jgi:hypothetical protein
VIVKIKKSWKIWLAIGLYFYSLPVAITAWMSIADHQVENYLIWLGVVYVFLFTASVRYPVSLHTLGHLVLYLVVFVFLYKNWPPQIDPANQPDGIAIGNCYFIISGILIAAGFNLLFRLTLLSMTWGLKRNSGEGDSPDARDVR